MKKTIVFFAAAVGLIFSSSSAVAGSATWLANPGSGDWNAAANWTPGGPPNDPVDTATFGSSAVNNLSLSANTQVGGITFSTGGATPYTITASPTFALIVSGTGIANNSGITQAFIATANNGKVQFAHSASAGFNAAITANGGAASGEASGITEFRDNSSAGHATFITNSGTASGAFGGTTQFLGSSTAGNGSFTTNGRTVRDAGSGVTLFYDTTSAGNASFATNRGTVEGALGGYVIFLGNSTAGNGAFSNEGADLLYAGGGVTQFFDNSSAGNGVFTNHPGNTIGGAIQFFNTATADHGAFTLESHTLHHGNGGLLDFRDSSSAANGTFTINGGLIRFWPNTTAGAGTFIVNGSPLGGNGGFMQFGGGSAGNANFTINGSTRSDGFGGIIEFGNDASAANGTFTVNGSAFRHVVCPAICGDDPPYPAGVLGFFDTATADNATLIANGGVNGGDGGSIAFAGLSTAGIARIKLFGNALLAIYNHDGESVTIGSLEGDGGIVLLGSKNLTIGSTNLSTTFAGVLEDGDGRPGEAEALVR